MPTIQQPSRRKLAAEDMTEDVKQYNVRVSTSLHATSKSNAARLGLSLQDYTTAALMSANALQDYTTSVRVAAQGEGRKA
jgi:predicted HicB family RNase H-like nuclease